MLLMPNEFLVEEEVHLVKPILDFAHVETNMETLLVFVIKNMVTLKFTNLHQLLMLKPIPFQMAKSHKAQLIHKCMWTLHLLSICKSMTNLYFFLQQTHLIPSTNDIGSRSNQITSSRMVQLDHSSPEPNSSTIGNIYNSKFDLSCCLSNNHTSTCWLIDFGANDHICSSLHFFDSCYRIKPLNVYVPNNSSVQVHYAGNVQISPFISIFIVLYSDAFKVNLIFVSKLC